jgi:LPS export ABC transporter protein LptC
MQNSNKIRRILAFLVVAAATYLMVVIVLKFHRVKEPDTILADLPKNIDLSLQKVHHTNTKDGTLQWDLVARKVDYYNDTGIVRFAGAEMALNGGGKNGKYSLKADTADYHKKTGDVKLKGNVTASSETGMKFSAGHLDYVAARALITTDDRVRIEDGTLSVQGTGMEVHVDTKKMRLLHDVNAVIGTRKK